MAVFLECLNSSMGIDRGLSGKSLLRYASEFSQKGDNQEIVRILIDMGVDPNVEVACGCTVLICSAGWTRYSSTERTIRMLTEAGADPNSRSVCCRSALYTAVSHSNTKCSTETVRALIEAGADPNIKNYVNKTVLTSAVSICYTIRLTIDFTEIINMLIEANTF